MHTKLINFLLEEVRKARAEALAFEKINETLNRSIKERMAKQEKSKDLVDSLIENLGFTRFYDVENELLGYSLDNKTTMDYKL